MNVNVKNLYLKKINYRDSAFWGLTSIVPSNVSHLYSHSSIIINHEKFIFFTYVLNIRYFKQKLNSNCFHLSGREFSYFFIQPLNKCNNLKQIFKPNKLQKYQFPSELSPCISSNCTFGLAHFGLISKTICQRCTSFIRQHNDIRTTFHFTYPFWCLLRNRSNAASVNE